MVFFRIVLLIFSLLFVCCQIDEPNPIDHRYIDSTVYIINNKSGKNLEINIWGLDDYNFAATINDNSKNVNVEFEYSNYPKFFPEADSCTIVYDGITKISFYPMKDFSWDSFPIEPLNHNDSLLVHYPFRASNCNISIVDTESGKQRMCCEYIITEDDYYFAKKYGK